MSTLATSAQTSDSFTRDRVTWLMYALLSIYGYVLNALGPIAPFLRTELNLTYTIGSLHSSAFAIGIIAAGVTGDSIVRRWGRQRAFQFGAIGLGCGMLAFVIARHPILTIASCLVMGGVGSLLLVLIPMTLADRHGAHRAVALTEANVGGSMAAVIAPLLVGAFERAGLGWRAALLLALAPLLFLIVWIMREPALPGKASAPSLAQPRSRLPVSYWAYWTVLVLAVAVEFCTILWGTDLNISRGLTPADAAIALSLFPLAMLLGRAAGSRLSQRMQPAQLLLGALVVASCGFPLYWLARTRLPAFVGLSVMGLGVANLYPQTLALAVGAVPHQSESASARASIASGVAIFAGPLLFGWIGQQIGIRSAQIVVAVLLGAMLLASQITRRLAHQST